MSVLLVWALGGGSVGCYMGWVGDGGATGGCFVTEQDPLISCQLLQSDWEEGC